jgi:flagellar protein FlaF
MKSGYEAYGQVHKNSLSGRALEGEAFMKAVTLLMRAQDFPGNKRLLVEAVNFTRKLWTVVQADLKAPANKVDEALKANLLSLSLFVDKQCMEAIEKPHPHHVLQGLIDVNKNVASGLLG